MIDEQNKTSVTPLWDTIKAAWQIILGAATMLATLAVIAAIATGSVILWFVVLGSLSMAAGLAYRDHPLATSAVIFVGGVVLAGVILMAGHPLIAVIFCALPIFGVFTFIDPHGGDPGVKVDLAKARDQVEDMKIYSLSILSLPLIITGTSLLAAWIATLPHWTDWSWVAAIPLTFGILLVCSGCKYALRLKDYRTDPEKYNQWEFDRNMDNWKKERKEKADRLRAERAKRFPQLEPVPTPKQEKRQARKKFAKDLGIEIFSRLD